MLIKAKRFLLILVGLISLALGVLGVFLPLLPTTPFVLVSALAFANSSDRLHQWLLDHHLFGPLITNWQRYGAISRPTKMLSLLSMVAVVVISLLLGVPTFVILIQVLAVSVSATFIVTRPLPPQ